MLPSPPSPASPDCRRQREVTQACRASRQVAGRHFGFLPQHLDTPRRSGARVSLARQTAIYLAHVELGLPYGEIARAFGRTLCAIRHACAKIENLRDDAAFDASLERLGQRLRGIATNHTCHHSQGRPAMSQPSIRTIEAVADGLSRDAIRLLRALAEPGAYAIAAGEDEPGRLVVVAQSKGVSLRRLSVCSAAGAALVTADLASWQPPGPAGRSRLAATPEGVAHAARMDAPAGIAPFAAQHAPMVRATLAAPEGGTAIVTLNAAESPLAWLARRKGRDGRALIDAIAFQAGERLRADLTLAQMLPNITSNWSNQGAGGGFDGSVRTYSDLVVAARQRVTRALDAAGPEFSGLLMDICSFLKGLELIESERGWPARSGKVVLALALARLAAHYGLRGEARGPDRSRGIRQWGAEGYRPVM